MKKFLKLLALLPVAARLLGRRGARRPAYYPLQRRPSLAERLLSRVTGR